MSDDVQVEVHQNEYLPAGGAVVDAIASVTVAGGAGSGRAGARDAAEIIMIDCSGSMSGGKLTAAKNAAAVAVDTLRDGVRFAIVAGDHRAWTVFPSMPSEVMARADARSRAAATSAVKRIAAGGGTAMGVWLNHARELFVRTGAELNHGILLTDGQNGEDPRTFTNALQACAGVFTCDSRGVGRGWSAKDLIRVAEALLGTAEGIKDPAHLADDFRAMTESAMGKTMADVTLRVWTPAGARVRYVKQMFPDIIDLTGRRTEVSPRVGDYPTGSWGADSRDYHVSVEVAPDDVGEEVLAARISVVHQGNVLAQGLVRAVWTDDTDQSTKINGRVAHYNGEAELASALQEGLDARAAGDLDTATSRLTDAAKLARRSGRADTAKLIANVLDYDEGTGTAKLRTSRDNADIGVDAEMAALGSRKTNRIRPA
jgi:hypothetical protein